MNKSNTRQKNVKRRNWLILAAVVIIILVVAAFYVRARNQANSANQYQTAQAEKGTLTATIGATGTVRSNQTAILTWQTNGTVGAVNVKAGDQVKAGDVLATILSSSLAQNIILAQSDLVTAQKNLDNLNNSHITMYQAELALYTAQDALAIAQTRYDIAKNTYGETSTARAFLEAKTNLALAHAKVDDAQREWNRLQNGPDPNDIAAAQARVDAAQAALRAAKITVPFDGIVTEVNAMVGDQVSPGVRAFRVDDLSTMLVDVQVSEVDINSVQIGQPVTITFDAISGTEYHGKVVEVAQAGDVVQGSVTFTVTVQLTDGDVQVKPGMTAAITITVKQLDNVLLVPNRAVRVVNNQRVVYVLLNGQVKEVQITLGATSDTVSEVVSGDLKVGDAIILNPPSTLFNNPSGGGPFGGGN
jgi:HlyD family secretion protein